MTVQEQYKLTDEQKAAIKDFAKRLAAGDPEAVAHANSVGITIITFGNKPDGNH